MMWVTCSLEISPPVWPKIWYRARMKYLLYRCSCPTVQTFCKAKEGMSWGNNWNMAKGTYFKPFEKLLVNFTQNLVCILSFSIHPGYDLPLWIQWFSLELRIRESFKAERSDWLLSCCQTPWLHTSSKAVRCKVSLESWRHQPQV